mmetsp:Transcript_31883/g.78205  ORF Transcript_31883/g.78205 Transcript_31883/m.78205 type:complete len:217 (-) Transcript_31883:307-957(-)
MPPPCMPVVEQAIQNKVLDAAGMRVICMYGHGLHSLIENDRKLNSIRAQEGRLSSALVRVLAVSLGLARACLVANNSQIPETKPWDRPDWTPFEEMVRTGTCAPNNPVVQTLPHFRQDFLNDKKKAKARGDKDTEREVCTKILREQAAFTADTCTKYKMRHRALTPGLFTVFCGGCGRCLAWELMACTESPATPFKLFALRAWTPAQHEAYANMSV